MTLRTAIIVAALSATAAHAEMHYFGGHYQCRNPSYLNMAIEYGSPTQANIWYYNRTMSSPSFLQGKAEKWTEKGGYLEIPYSDDLAIKGKQATWMRDKDKADEDCTTFTLTPKEKPLTEYDHYLKLLKEVSTDDKGMNAVNTAEFALPPRDMLPDLDRTAYSEQIKTAEQDYWKRALEDRAKAAFTLPIDGDGTAYINKVKPLFGTDMGPNGSIAKFDYSWREQVYRDQTTMAYRLAMSGANPQLARYSDDEICARTKYNDGLYGEQAATFIVGVPFPFWDRDFTQPVIDTLRKCEHTNSANWLVENFPKINAASERYRAVSNEIQALLAKPDTYETFVETNGLRLKPEILELQKLKNEDIDIFSAGLLEQKRGRIIEALSEALPGLIDKKLQEKDYDRSYTLCNDVLPNHNDFRALNQLYQNCTEIAPARIAQITLDKAVARAESADTLNAAEAADWLVLPRVYDAPEDAVAAAEAKLNAPRQRIADLILVTAEKAIVANRNETIDKSICPVAYDAPDIIKNAMKLCASRIGEHNVAVEEAQCDAAVNAAGKAREIANANIRLFLDGYLGGREREMNIRKLICDSRGHIDIEISGDGWFGSARDLTLKLDDKTVKAVIEPDKNGVWIVTKVKGKTPKDGFSPAACLFGDTYCE